MVEYLKIITTIKRNWPLDPVQSQFSHFTVYKHFLEHYLFGVFAKLRKATIGFVMSVCPSGRMELFGFYWMDFIEIWYCVFF